MRIFVQIKHLLHHCITQDHITIKESIIECSIFVKWAHILKNSNSLNTNII